MSEAPKTEKKTMNFLEEMIDTEMRSGKIKPDNLLTRFPPEPNGYLHWGMPRPSV